LNLPAGVGLLVERVDENGPAAKVLQKKDVLHKFDDQLLVNHEQLQALLRTHQPGDIVTLTVIRDGQSRPCAVQLGGKIQQGTAGGSHPQNNSSFDSALAGVPDEIAEAMRIVLGKVGSNMNTTLPQVSVMVSSNLSALAQGIPQVSIVISTNVSVSTRVSVSTNASASAYAYSSSSGSGGPKGGLSKDRPHLLGNHSLGTNSVTVIKPGTGGRTFTSTQSGTGSSRVCVKSNERGTFTLTSTDGQKHFKAVGNDGKTLYDGPINTDEELGKLSDDLKKELDALENNTRQAEQKSKARPDMD
jgi:hypothetical protein